MDKNKLNLVAFAALMHDIGKFARRSSEGFGSHAKESFNFIEMIEDDIIKKNIFSKEELSIAKWLVENHHESSYLSKKSTTEFENLLRILIYSDWDSASDRSFNTESERSSEYLPIHNILSFVNAAFDVDLATRGEDFEKAAEQLSQVIAFEPNDAFFYTGRSVNPNENVSDFNKNRFFKFKDDLKKAIESCNSSDEFILCLNHLLRRHTTFITSSGKEIIRDISLYNHSSTTAMFAVNRFIDYEVDQTIDRRSSVGVIYARLFKIQDYIFSGINSKIEKPLKRIITRSQLVSILNMLIPYDIIKHLNLYPFNIIFYGGGAFLVFVPVAYLDRAKKRISYIKNKVLQLFEGKIYFEAECDKIWVVDENNNYNIANELKRLGEKLSSKKFSRSFDTIPSIIYKDHFTKPYYKCDNCRINTSYVFQENEDYLCSSCHLENLWMNVDINTMKMDYEKLCIDNMDSPDSIRSDEAKKGLVLKFNNEAEQDQRVFDIFLQGRKFIYTYEICDKCPQRDKCDQTYKFISSSDKDRDIEEKIISTTCLEMLSKSDNIIATAKMDIDDLGFLLYQVYPLKVGRSEVYPFSMSRLSFMSWLLNLFFTEGVKKVIEKDFKNDVMILFSGGDDLLITGVWDKVIEAVCMIESEFSRFITGKNISNKNVTITSSIVFHRSNENFGWVANSVEEGLEFAKNYKNCVYLFEKVIGYNALRECLENVEKIVVYNKKKILTKSIIRKLFNVLSMRFDANADIKKKNPYLMIKAVSMYNYIKSRLIMGNDKLDYEKKKEVIDFLDDLLKINGEDDSVVSKGLVTFEIALRKLINSERSDFEDAK